MCLILLSALVTVSIAAPQNQWHVFKLTYSKPYMTQQEEYIRSRIFQKTLDFVKQHNKEYDMGLHTYTVGLNEFSDWTDEEYHHLLSTQFDSRPVLQEDEGYLSGPQPSNVDWRTRGAVRPVKNQGACGSSWAFAATSSLEGVCFLKHGTLFDLSEQQLVDCSSSFGNNGCNGGWHHFAYKYIQSCGGHVESRCYPYTAKEGTCKFESVKDCVACKVTGFRTGRGESGLAKALSSAGPVGVGINASRPGFKNYKSGIYDDRACSQTRLNHAATAVGFDDQAWIVRSSWGTSWGNSGYILMKRGYNICGITSQAHYPTM